jgi:uncharacterized protein
MTAGGRLLRVYRQGRTHTGGYLEDHAFLIAGLIDLYQATFDAQWLDQAVALNEQVRRHFRDETNGGFFNVADDAEKLLVRTKTASDEAIASGNAVQATNLLRLAALLDRADLEAQAEGVFAAVDEQLLQMPHRHERLLAAVDLWQRRPMAIAFVWLDQADAAGGSISKQLDALLDAAWQEYIPNAVFAGLNVASPQAASLAENVPLLKDRRPLGGSPTAFVCRNRTCLKSTTDPAVLRSQLTRSG